ncbi:MULTISPECIES: glucose 1-dehydrogenase [unclassified Bradyrhizobium]|uniref:glucose 1-dehydrogenase n=1 Tax=unclassified Bradyrhizobium TaxID=2631580 RepID=UPI002305028F|nr:MULTISPECIES: glucose 1-dehydrogenase [unclassified Bradyrhizobium]MDA9451220.1 hypothetical protein [Bradyrhizobium sp. CCBAU 21360]MDA9457599.1 hypothetical protein [Bradyrhizobium sp. CCBAU 21359]
MAAHSEHLDRFSLSGKTALVTGAARGLGFAFAAAAARAGAHVVLNDRNSEALSEAMQKLRKEGLSCSVSLFDVSSAEEVTARVDEIAAECGRIDILVNNAGNQNRKPFLDYTASEWRSVLDVHLTGSFLVSQAVIRHMLPQQSGSIIMIGSIMVECGRGTIAPYRAAKGAVTALGKQLAVEFGPHNIRCNIIAPGYVETELTRDLVANADLHGQIARRVPMGRWATPDDIAPTMVFLSSDAGRYVNGHVLYVDGGTLASL